MRAREHWKYLYIHLLKENLWEQTSRIGVQRELALASRSFVRRTLADYGCEETIVLKALEEELDIFLA